MLIDLTRNDLLNLIYGLRCGRSYEEAEYLTKIGAAYFSGNQHNENWSWNIDYFKPMTEEELVNFYNKYKNK